MTEPKVLYDESCPLCCHLAKLMERHAHGRLAFESWQSFWSVNEVWDYGGEPRVQGTIPPPDRLHVVVDGRIYGGLFAWEYVLEQHPDFSSLNWLAERLGLARKLAQGFQSSAGLLKRLCRRCPKPR